MKTSATKSNLFNLNWIHRNWSQTSEKTPIAEIENCSQKCDFRSIQTISIHRIELTLTFRILCSSSAAVHKRHNILSRNRFDVVVFALTPGQVLLSYRLTYIDDYIPSICYLCMFYVTNLQKNHRTKGSTARIVNLSMF